TRPWRSPRPRWRCCAWGCSPGCTCATAGRTQSAAPTRNPSATDPVGRRHRRPVRAPPGSAPPAEIARDDLAARTHAQLADDVGDMPLDGVQADAERERDALVAGSLDDQRDHLALARGQIVVMRRTGRNPGAPGHRTDRGPQ